MGSDRADTSAFHEDDAVGILNAGYTLSDNDLGGFRDKFTETLADQSIGTGIYGARGVVQDQDLRLL